MRKPDIRELYYITHRDNLPSILELGILSHDSIQAKVVEFTPVYDEEIVSGRQQKSTPDRTSLWSYANLYFQPRNPMMYRIVHERKPEDLAVVGVKKDVLDQNGIFITDGNAASAQTRISSPSEGLKILRRQWSIIQSDWWNNSDGSKRKIMAECLLPNQVQPADIHSIYLADNTTGDAVRAIVGNRRIEVSSEPDMFFQPNSRTQIGDNIFLIDGDMFFSNLQTLTISVNLQGVMGKGLASRAKYQFPDVYVAYQDACRSKRITAIGPYLYKRESSFDEELADTGSPLSTPNAVKWFLLFATKRKWRENSRLDDIEGGLEWIRRKYEVLGIESLAMPALGCGLGGLDWKDVGPLMCRYLHGLDITVAIYLPREHSIDPQYLTDSYLLGSQQGSLDL